MNINSIGNAGIYNIQNQGASKDIHISPEALENMKKSLRDSIHDHLDTIELSENYGIQLLKEESYDPYAKAELSTVFTGSEVSEKARSLSLLMDERQSKVDAWLGWTLDYDQTYRDKMAQRFGEIGRELDSAFAAGEITQQEYDDLNNGLAKYTEVVTSRVERSNAVMQVLRKNAQAMDAMMNRGASQKEFKEFAKWNRETLEDRIHEFIERSCKIDRNLLSQLVQQVRGGQDLIEPATRQADSQGNMVWHG